MASKKSDNKAVNDEAVVDSNNTTSELTMLRQIIFGAAQADIENRLADLESRMLDRFQQSDQKLSEHVKQISGAMHSGFEDMQVRVNSVDKQYEDKTSELHAYADKLSSELEMSDSNGRQDTDELHSRVDKEVLMLTEKYDARFAEALERLDQVTKELSSTKTDRKTLAKLLATMAINLETDEE